MKHFLVILVFGSLALLVLVWAGQFISPGAIFAPGSYGSGNVGPSGGYSYSSDYSTETNPLLDFGYSSGADYGNYGSGYGGYGDTPRSQPNTDGVGTSPYSGRVDLSYGTASYAIQTYEEYVTLRNSGDPVNITGWVLTNSKGTRPIENRQNNYVYPVADSATIGLGTTFLNPSGVFQTGPIVLQKGDTAYLTTGKAFSQFPFSIYTSFRENICVGYLEYYPFYPQINRSCPAVSNDPSVRTVTDECYDYIRSINSCTDPAVKDKKRFDLLTTQCRAFISARVGYNNCVAQNKNLSNFSLNQWRIFLGKEREMWASDRETITLYDSQGLIVDQISY